MQTDTLPPDLSDWAQAQVAAGRAESFAALVADALAALKSQQDAIAAKLAAARAEADREGWIEGEAALAELCVWIAEDEAEDAAKS